MNKKLLTERDICTKFITPSLEKAGWDLISQVREEVSFTDGRIYVRGKLHTRGAKKELTTFFTTNQIFQLRLLRQRTTTIELVLEFNKRWAMPIFWIFHSFLVVMAMDICFMIRRISQEF